MLLSLERKQKLIAFCQEAIRCKSPSGQEGDIAALLSSMMKKMNFNRVSVDRYGNVVGQVILGKGGQKLLMEGHLDHVDVSDPSKWHYDPYGGEIADNKIYGRGTSDMKGNLCAMLMAAAYVLEDKGSELNGEILVAGSVHEECFEGVASEEIGINWKPDKVIIGEASNLTVKRGQRGRAEVVVETSGKTAHSSTPSVGVNAVKKMAHFIETLEQTFKPAVHPVLGEGILEVTDIISSPYPGASVIPERCRATFDRRLLVGEDAGAVLRPLQNLLEHLSEQDSDFKAQVSLAKGAEICYTGESICAERFAPGWLFEEGHPFIQEVLSGLRSVGQEPLLSHYYFCTNGSYYAGKAGIPTVGYGGSLETLAHVVDEYIEIEQLLKACEGYYGIISSCASQTENQSRK